MSIYEYVGNLHVHTTASDGTAPLEEVARIADRVGLDFLVVTDHNVLLPDGDGYRSRTLVLIGEEVHDPERSPEVNHYLALGISRDVGHLAPDPQAVIDAVNEQGGFGFIAHPLERNAPLIGQPEFPWVDWGVTGYAGLSIWNYMSEVKSYATSETQGVLLAYFPSLFMRGPFPETLAKWDELLRGGGRVAAICGSDVHAGTYQLGLLRRVVFPYEHCFRVARTHLLTREPLNGDVARDRRLVYDALRHGRAFVAYDRIGNSRGFRFTARNGSDEVGMGDEIALAGGVELEVTSPLPAELRLVRDGFTMAWSRGRTLRFRAEERGAYRVEARRRYLFLKRGWVFTNPIYVR